MTRPGLADTAAIAFMLSVKPHVIRTWAYRHPAELPRRGKHGHRTLYAIEDAEKLADRLRPGWRDP